MDIEFLLYWIFTGITCDFMAMLFLSYLDKNYWQGYLANKELDFSYAPDCSISAKYKETPWWAHVILIACPPSALLIAGFE